MPPPVRITPLTGAPGSASSATATDIGRGPNRFLGTSAVACAPAGTVFVCGLRPICIAVAPDGVATPVDAVGPLSGAPWMGALAVDRAGALYVADASAHDVRVVRDGATESLTAPHTFTSPAGLAVDDNGDVFVCDTDAHAIYVVRDGVSSVFAGMPGEPGAADGDCSSARFKAPVGLALAPLGGGLLVADQGNSTIRLVHNGIVTTVAGSPGVVGGEDGIGAAARFRGARGVVHDGHSTVFIADTGNSSVRCLSLNSGAVSTLTDEAGAALRVTHPLGVAVQRGEAGVATALFVAHMGKQLCSRIDFVAV